MDHAHCMSCVSSHCSQQSPCSMDHCPNGCGFIMHQCKLAEHDRYTCPEAVTPCVNANYGCDDLLKRKQLTAHIEHCPASIVCCSFSHERTEMIIQKLVGTGRASVQDDGITTNIEHSSDGSLVCNFSYDTPEVSTTNLMSSGEQPMEEEKDNGREFLVDEKLLQGDLNVWRMMKEKQERKSSANDLASGYSEHMEADIVPPNLSVDMNIGFLTYKGSRDARIFSAYLLTKQRTCVERRVSFTLSIFEEPKRRIKTCTFLCGGIVRRDEFATHWKSQHVDIQVDIHQIVRRCPMRYYGCQYGVLNLTPNPKGSTLDYNEDTDCFLYKPPPIEFEVSSSDSFVDSAYAAKIQAKQELAMYGYEDDEEESYDVLGQLPAEVLMNICGYLDSQSLWHFSQVNHYLRKVCLNVVKKIGMVSSVWERDSSGSWTLGPKIWSYSKAIRRIPSWRYTDEPNVAAHMMSCDFFKSNVKQYAPVRVHCMF